jgi:sucrose-6-phosphate hydrolase SacC (GH32 family)
MEMRIKRGVLALFLGLFIASAAVFGGAGEAGPVYLFTSFRGNGEDGLYLAYSRDGLSWTPINNNEPLLAPRVGEARLMRDPSLVRGPDGVFHMVWTAGWWERGIGYAHSEDLIHWSEQRYISVMEHEEQARNTWAPELFYDEEAGEYLIVWSTTIRGRFPETAGSSEDDLNHRLPGYRRIFR